MAREIGRKGTIRVAVADDSGLIYSDDYRTGWVAGFKGIGCEVRAFDVSQLRRANAGIRSPYRSTAMRGIGKLQAQTIAKWSPDLVWCHHGRASSNSDFLETLHRSGIRTAVYLCDEPYEVGETAKYSPRFKYVFTMDPCTVDVHRLGRDGRKNVYYLPPGADDSHFVYRKYFGTKRTGSGSGFEHDALIRKTPCLFLGNADLIPRRDWLLPIERLVDGADIKFFPSRSKGRPVSKGHPQWVPLKDHPKLYSRCLVGLNVHRSPAITNECYKRRVLGRSKHEPVPKGLKLCETMPKREGTGFWNDGNLPAAHLNPRFMEMAACGTLVVSDDTRSELARMFPMAPRAKSPEHFYELIDYYLHHLSEAEEIGKACSFLISMRHTYRHRAAEVLIRVGLRAALEGNLRGSLAEPEDWLSPQDCGMRGVESFSDPIGPSERWSPAFGMSWTREFGKLNAQRSIDVQITWL